MNEIELGSSTPTIFKDPFNKKCVDRIVIWVMPKSTIAVYQAEVHFINNNTIGQQNFREDSYDTMMAKVQAFLNTLT